ncbi:MAG TPA: chromate efflux transporter, partial [Burkholderiales bacterium]|nr:chromate efflux transporter [Burkholderiales bacterium]
MNNQSDLRNGRLAEIAATFLKLGALSYGGPAIMGIMQSEIQEKRGWMSKERFVEGLALVNMLPGPVATQLGIFIGYDRAGWRGGVLAGLCFMLPAFLILMCLTLLYSKYGSVGLVRDAFYGIGPVVLAIFIVAVWRLGKASLKSRSQIAIALASAAIVALTPIGIATALLLAGCVGVALFHSRVWGVVAGACVLAVAVLSALFLTGMPQGTSTFAVAPDLTDLALFFLKVGAVTFGGGITVLAFVQEQVVNQLQWLSAQEFLDGLALGQLTPGPLLMLAAYIGFKTAGFVGGVASACAIFLPAFVLMLCLLPVLQRFKDVGWLKAAMKGTMPAVI